MKRRWKMLSGGRSDDENDVDANRVARLDSHGLGSYALAGRWLGPITPQSIGQERRECEESDDREREG